MITHPAFDTLKFVQKLKNAGMPEPQAIALTQAQNEALMESTDHMVATKTDLLELKQVFRDDLISLRQELKDDMTGLRQEFRDDMTSLRQEFRNDMTCLRQEFKQDMVDLRQECKQDIFDLKSQVITELGGVKSTLKVHNWILGSVLTGISALILKSFFT